MKKSLLITGSSGFIGKNFLKKSRVLNDFKITALYNSSKPSHISNQKIIYKRANLLNKNECKNLFKDFDIIVHFAGVMMTSSASKNNPFNGINENLQIFTNIIEEIKDKPPEKFLWMSSTTGYPASNKDLIEKDFFLGEVPKRYAIVGSLYRLMETIINKILRDKCILLTLRPTGVFGEEDDFSPESSHVLPKIIRESYFKMLPDIIYAEKEEKRNWIYVGDLVKSLDILLLNLDKSQTLNIGAKKSISMYELNKTILKKFSLEESHLIDPDSTIYGPPMARNIDCSLSERYLGNYNNTPFEEGIQKTINWYKKYLED